MKRIACKEVPNLRERNDLQAFIEDFAYSFDTVCKIQIEEGEYKKPIYAYKSLWSAVKRSPFTNIKVVYINGDTYLVKV